MKYRNVSIKICVCLLLVGMLSACSSTSRNDTTTQTPALSQDSNKKVKSTARKRASKIEAPDYKEKIDSILSLARRNRWAEAEAEAAALLSVAPNDTTVLRVYTWVKKENTARKESELENQLSTMQNNTETNPENVQNAPVKTPEDGLNIQDTAPETVQNEQSENPESAQNEEEQAVTDGFLW